jgi:hypothetical protein
VDGQLVWLPQNWLFLLPLLLLLACALLQDALQLAVASVQLLFPQLPPKAQQVELEPLLRQEYRQRAEREQLSVQQDGRPL